MIGYIYDGSKSELSLKGWTEFSDSTPLTRAASKESYSVVTLVGDIATQIKEFDLIQIENNDISLWGAIIEAVLTESDVNTIEVTIALSTDWILAEAYRQKGQPTTETDMYDWLYEQYKSIFLFEQIEGNLNTPIQMTKFEDRTSFEGYVLFSDLALPYAQCCRQLIKQGINFKYEIRDNYLYMIPYKKVLEPIELNLEDTLKYTIQFSKDTINSLRVFSEADDKQTFRYTLNLTKSGEIKVLQSMTQEEMIRPIKQRTEVFDAETWTQDALNTLKNQQYENYVEIIINKDYIYYDWLFKKDNPFYSLGREVRLYLPEYDYNVKSVIEEIEFTEKQIKIVFSQGNRRLFDKLKGVN